MQQDITGGTIKEIPVPLHAGVPVQLETRNLSANADPVLNLLSPAGVEVASDDNGAGGRAAKISYFPSATGNYTLIIRARTTQGKGTGDVYRDNVHLLYSGSFGGIFIVLHNLRRNETIQTVKLPRGANATHHLYLLKGDGVGIFLRAGNTGADGAAYIKLATNLGAKMVMVGTEGPDGLLRLICNDAALPGHDPDHDGLGTELETEIGTCPLRGGFALGVDCSKVADPRDTDGDGIPDGWEVLGRNDVSPSQPLPKWGANPRHKDLFIEVDFMRRTFQDNVNSTLDHMTPEVARHFAAIYGDSLTTLPSARLQHAITLQNPDALPGISTHLDIGIDPLTPADATIYGNWGGFNAVNAIPTATGYAGVDPNIGWRLNMNVARRRIFRYALGYVGGGGSCGNNYACAFNFHDQSNTAHEWGHTMGLGHSGPYNATGAIDPNCKPNYESIMNYAFYGQPNESFSDGTGAPPLNNASLTEWNAVPPSNTLYLDVLQNVFHYWVDRVHGHVDWNRDGVFAPAGQKVRAYANYEPGSSCEFTRYNQSPVGDANTTTTPVLGRLGNRLYVFYTKDGALKYRFSTSSWNCPQPAPSGCAEGSWSAERDAGVAPAVGVDVANDGISLRVVTVLFNGKIMEKRLTLVADIESWTGPTQIPGSAAGEPSISYGLTASYLVYKGTDLNIHFNLLHAGVWQGDQVAYTGTNMPLKSTSDWAFPAIIQTILPHDPTKKGLYALVPDPNAKLNLWYYNPSTNFWELTTNILEGFPVGPIHNKPSMAYVPYNAIQSDPGRLYMVYILKSQPGSVFTGQVRMKMSYVKVTTNPDGTFTKQEKIGLDSPFDNTWFYAYGINLFFDPAHDTNLRSVFSAATGNTTYPIIFRPKADAINDFTYTNYNDWNVLGVKLCEQVVNPGRTIKDPIGCPIR